MPSAFLIPSAQLAPEARELVARGSLPAGHIALALPEDPRGTRAFRAASARLDALAGDLVASAESDFERVLTVVEHLRSSFAYELYSVDFLGTEGCGALLERGGGSCTHFASLAVMLLRRAGIPARIAAGYVARERIEAPEGGGRWLVRQRDGHAWIEVHFEGAGWLPFDPTPGDATVGGALRGYLAGAVGGIAATVRRTSSLAALVIDGARRSGLGPDDRGRARGAPDRRRVLREDAAQPSARRGRRADGATVTPVANPPALDRCRSRHGPCGTRLAPTRRRAPRRHAARIEAENLEAAGPRPSWSRPSSAPVTRPRAPSDG